MNAEKILVTRQQLDSFIRVLPKLRMIHDVVAWSAQEELEPSSTALLMLVGGRCHWVYLSPDGAISTREPNATEINDVWGQGPMAYFDLKTFLIIRETIIGLARDLVHMATAMEILKQRPLGINLVRQMFDKKAWHYKSSAVVFKDLINSTCEEVDGEVLIDQALVERYRKERLIPV